MAAEDRRVLPESYEGFEIDLVFSSEGLKVTDNCGGISVDNLRSMVLRFGKRSMHDMGIGVFGVGLNRALFKLGRISHLKTDTGTQRAELVLETAKYLRSGGLGSTLLRNSRQAARSAPKSRFANRLTKSANISLMPIGERTCGAKSGAGTAASSRKNL